MRETVIKLRDEVKQLWMATDSLSAFTDWPDDLIASNSAPKPAPAVNKILAWHLPGNNETSPLVHAVQQAAFHVNWQFINTEEEIGRHFLDNYAYFEVNGPTGQPMQCVYWLLGAGLILSCASSRVRRTLFCTCWSRVI